MARSRNIKPGFFKNEVLAECSHTSRLLFVGLWTLADRDGRLEDRPVRIKGELFPYEQVNVDAGLAELAQRHFILRYIAGELRVIQINNFVKHQNPHKNESPSELPAFSSNYASVSANGGSTPADSLLLIPDSLSSDSLDCVVAAPRPTTPPAVEPSQVSFPEFPCASGRSHGPATWLLSESQIDEWASAFPGVDVSAEARKAHAWVKANLDRRKTAKGMPNFLVKWLSREQDRSRGHSAASSTTPPQRKPYVPPMPKERP